MNQHVRNTVIMFLIVCGPAFGTDCPRSGDAVRQSLARYHADAEPNGDTLRIVYFCPSDVEPQSDYRARITRIMLDIQVFL
jgi:hypothetical protein